MKSLLKNKYLLVYVGVMALLLVPSMAFAAPHGTASLDIDFESALSTIFDYAEMIFTALVPIAAIGIGFRFGGTILAWVGDMLGNAFRLR